MSKGAGIGGHATGPGSVGGHNPTADETYAAIRAMGEANENIVADYMGNAYSGMNSYLLHGPQPNDLSFTRHVAKRVRLLQKTLLEAPQTTTHAVRGVQLDKETLAGMKPGATWRAKNFFSTSEGHEVTEEFAHRNTVLHIVNARGVNVRALAGFVGEVEKEVLLPAGRRFRIEGHVTTAEGRHIIHMRQLN